MPRELSRTRWEHFGMEVGRPEELHGHGSILLEISDGKTFEPDVSTDMVLHGRQDMAETVGGSRRVGVNDLKIL